MLDYLKQKSKLNLLANAVAVESLVDSQDENLRVQKAENDFYIRQLGSTPSEQANKDDEVRQIILGDVNHLPDKQPTQNQSLLGPLTALVLGTMIPGAGIAGYIASQYLTEKAEPVVSEILENSQDVSIGLGRIEDYETQE